MGHMRDTLIVLGLLVIFTGADAATAACKWSGFYDARVANNVTTCDSLTKIKQYTLASYCRSCAAKRTKVDCLKATAYIMHSADTYSCAWVAPTATAGADTVEMNVNAGANGPDFMSVKLRSGVCSYRMDFQQLSPTTTVPYKLAGFSVSAQSNTQLMPLAFTPQTFCTVDPTTRKCSLTVATGVKTNLFRIQRFIWTDDLALVRAQNTSANRVCARDNSLTSTTRCVKARTTYQHSFRFTEVRCRSPLPSPYPVKWVEERPFGVKGYLFRPGADAYKSTAFFYNMYGASRIQWSVEVKSGGKPVVAAVVTAATLNKLVSSCTKTASTLVCNFQAALSSAIGTKCLATKCSGLTIKDPNDVVGLLVAYPKVTSYNADPARLNPAEVAQLKVRVALTSS